MMIMIATVTIMAVVAATTAATRTREGAPK